MRARLLFFGSIALAATLAACGGGGGGGGGGSSVIPTPTPTATSSGPISGSSTVTFSSPTTEPLPSGFSGTVTIPGGSGTATVTYSSAANTNTTTIYGTHIKPKSTSATLRTAQSSGPYTGVLYVTITATSNVLIDGYPGFSVPVSSSSTQYYLGEYYEGYWYSVTGPSQYSNGSEVLAATTSPAITLAKGQSLYLAVYTGGVLPSPNPDGCDGVQADTAGRTEHTSAVGVQPINSGATFQYTGTLSETIYRSQPCAQPTATSSAAVTITVSASPDPNGADTDEDSTETDAYATNSTQVSTVAVVSPVPGSPSTLNELKETSTDLSGDTTVTTYGSTGLVYSVTSPLPYSGSSISNAPPSTVNATFADGTTADRTYSGTAGAYSETDTIAGLSTPDRITVSANGAATYDINSANFASQDVGSIELTYSAPSGGVINLSADFGGTTQTLAIPQWWTQSQLYTDTVSGGSTSNSLPAGCATTSGITQYAPITRTITSVDPALGTIETEAITSYIGENYPSSGEFAGPVCVAINDTLDLYYDYFLDTPSFFYFSITGTPIQTDTISEVYSWNSAPTGLTRVRAQALRSADMASLQSSIDAHNAGIQFARLKQRAQRIEFIDQSIATKGLGGIK